MPGEPKWIRFEKERPHPSRVTDIWTVYERESSTAILGQVRWFGRWRRYAFHPSLETVFEQECLRDIAEFCEKQTRARQPGGRADAHLTEGDLERAVRRALTLFDLWNEVTGFVPRGSSYLGEIEGVVTDAVHCGAQAATGDYKRLEDEPAAVFRAARGRR